jgi:hypothetical protein
LIDFVEENHAQANFTAIVAQARTGRLGDGKALILPWQSERLGW